MRGEVWKLRTLPAGFVSGAEGSVKSITIGAVPSVVHSGGSGKIMADAAVESTSIR